MNNILRLIILFLVVNNIGFSQTKEDATRDAKTTSEATLKEDYKTVIKHTYPSVVNLMGGEENAINFINKTFETMKSQGLTFEKADVVNVSDVVFEQDQYRCYVENFYVMKMNNMRINSKSFLLGLYNNEDKFWYFLEAKQLKSNALMDAVLPNFETSLVIPDNEMTTEPIED
jgi:hypothetical protein